MNDNLRQIILDIQHIRSLVVALLARTYPAELREIIGTDPQLFTREMLEEAGMRVTEDINITVGVDSYGTQEAQTSRVGEPLQENERPVERDEQAVHADGDGQVHTDRTEAGAEQLPNIDREPDWWRHHDTPKDISPCCPNFTFNDPTCPSYFPGCHRTCCTHHTV